MLCSISGGNSGAGLASFSDCNANRPTQPPRLAATEVACNGQTKRSHTRRPGTSRTIRVDRVRESGDAGPDLLHMLFSTSKVVLCEERRAGPITAGSGCE